MPNHVGNDLYIHGSTEDVAALLAFIGADQEPPQFDFDKIIPYPDAFKQRDKDAETFGWASKAAPEEKQAARTAFIDKYGDEKDGFNAGGYEWRRDNWGTKWGAYDVSRRDYQGACVTFQTAWSPAPKVIAALHKMFPKCSLHLEYFERGMELCGGISFLSELDSCDEETPWAAGLGASEWKGKYSGHRGG